MVQESTGDPLIVTRGDNFNKIIKWQLDDMKFTKPTLFIRASNSRLSNFDE
jgi:hypothetical protein